MKTIVVSNRVVDLSKNGAMPGGLAAALLNAVQKSGATWIGGSGKYVNKPVAQLPATVMALGAGELVTVDFPAGIYNEFYNGMANAALWPILHYRADLLNYEPAYAESYHSINAAMADTVCRVVEEAKEEPLIWVHDYHFFMLGDCLRQRGMSAPIGFFLHTPFPTRSVLVCLPGHRGIFKTLAAYDIIGFQTADDLLRFRDYATHELFATMVGQTELRFGDRRVRLGVFPVGIDVDSFAKAAQTASTAPTLGKLRYELQDSKLVIGVDRLDYSKGLAQRFLAYERFLTTYPAERKRVSFLQITPPTRGEVDAYQNMRAQLAGIAGDINARYGGVDWMALRYINEGFTPDMLAGFYRLSKVGCVTPLRDGMNLVAKEYLAAQDPTDPGVLVLSKFAGAARELTAALLINPYDTEAVALRLHQALYMPREERIERWQTLIQVLRRGSLQTWFESFIAAMRTCSIKSAPSIARNVA